MIRHQAPALLAFLSMFFVMLVVTPACSGHSKRIKTLQATLVAVNSARDGFIAWDLVHQKAIVERSTSRLEAEKDLAAYHQKRLAISGSFELVYRSLAAAATETDEASLRAALAKAGVLYDELKAMMLGKEGK